MGIDLYTTEELEKELKCRKMEKPKMLMEPKFANLRRSVENYINYISSEDYREYSEHRLHIFEKAVEAFYGNGVWDWYNKRT